MSGLQRFGPGDAVIGLSLVALVLAALLPTYRARAFDRLLEDATADVAVLRDAALAERASAGTWPQPGAPGAVPEAVTGAFGADTIIARDGYTVQWWRLDRVEHVEAPPTPPTPPQLDADETPPAVPAEPDPTDLPSASATPTLIPVVHRDGAVVVHSGDELLLAELLRRYGSEVSFVRDTTWTLVVPEPGDQEQ